MTTDREERIRQLAHAIWEREGHPHGRDAEHWRMATEAYEAEMAGPRYDDAGQPISVGPSAPEGETTAATTAASPEGAEVTSATASKPVAMRKRRTNAEMGMAHNAEVDAPKARRGRKPKEGALPLVEKTNPTTKRTRRTKAEMAAAAGAVGAVAAVGVAVAASKRLRGTKAQTQREAAPAPAANVALRPPRKRRAAPSEAEPVSAVVARDAALSAAPDPSGDEPADLAAGLLPDPGAEPPSDAAPESLPDSAPDTDSSGERVPD